MGMGRTWFASFRRGSRICRSNGPNSRLHAAIEAARGAPAGTILVSGGYNHVTNRPSRQGLIFSLGHRQMSKPMNVPRSYYADVNHALGTQISGDASTGPTTGPAGATMTLPDGFAAFYSSGYPTIYRAAYAFSNSSEIATEATQEAFARAFARWRRLHDQHWAMGWVMTTSLNVARKLRREGRRTFSSPDGRGGRAQTYEVAIARMDLVQELSALPPRQKQAVVLHYIGGYQITEVAQLMELSSGAVKSHLFKARTALRNAMSEESND